MSWPSATTRAATPSGTGSVVPASTSHQGEARGPQRGQKVEARRLFASGSTRRELMAMYDLSESTIKRMLAQPRRP